MNNEQQRQIVNDLIDSVKKSLLDKADRIPENWDGIELRQWVAETFWQERTAGKGIYSHLQRKRLRDYRTVLYNSNL